MIDHDLIQQLQDRIAKLETHQEQAKAIVIMQEMLTQIYQAAKLITDIIEGASQEHNDGV